MDREFDEAKFRETVDVEEYEKAYSEEKLWQKARRNVKSIGTSLLYKAMQIYYVTKSPECPKKVKLTLYGALGYLISPIDFLPDILPALGYVDDASAIAAALAVAAVYITPEIKEKAKAKLDALLGSGTAEGLS